MLSCIETNRLLSSPDVKPLFSASREGLKKHIPLNEFCIGIIQTSFNVVELVFNVFKSSLKIVEATGVNTVTNCFR